MKILLDTNILTRSSQPAHPQHGRAFDAVHRLALSGEVLYLAPQILYEFWTVATRPLGENGLNMSTAEAHTKRQELRDTFEVLHDTPAVLDAWAELVVQHDVKGKRSHDARLIATMSVHGVTALLTFNKSDFGPFPDITVLTPDGVLT
jgi:predicted nucleic acid-binding protein